MFNIQIAKHPLIAQTLGAPRSDNGFIRLYMNF